MRIAGVPVRAWGVVALVLAVVWAFVWPERDVEGPVYLILRWGHALVWLLLAVAAFLAPAAPTVAKRTSMAAGVVYFAFLAAVTVTG